MMYRKYAIFLLIAIFCLNSWSGFILQAYGEHIAGEYIPWYLKSSDNESSRNFVVNHKPEIENSNNINYSTPKGFNETKDHEVLNASPSKYTDYIALDNEKNSTSNSNINSESLNITENTSPAESDNKTSESSGENVLTENPDTTQEPTVNNSETNNTSNVEGVTENTSPAESDNKTSESENVITENADTTQTPAANNATSNNEEVKDHLVIVGLADFLTGNQIFNGYIDDISRDDNYKSGFYSDSRLAFFIKGKVNGKYMIKAGLDTKRDENESRKVIFRRIDPDKYYPIYGDESTRTDEISSQGRFYFLMEWDKSMATWGNFNTGITGAELTTHNRSLYGGRVSLISLNETESGQPYTHAVVYGARANQLASHNEFYATGGSLYYLSERLILEGSEKIQVQVRDKITGVVKKSFIQRIGFDYEIDYIEGRVMFKHPIFSATDSDLIIDDNLLGGDQVYIVTDFEYETEDMLKRPAYGVRVSQYLNNDIRVGASYISEDQGVDQYRLGGVDADFNIGKNTKIKAEFANSYSQDINSLVSYDGGLTFGELTGPGIGQQTGSANKVEIESLLGKVFDKNREDSDIRLTAFYRKQAPGFSQVGSSSQEGTEKYGADFSTKLSEFVQFRINYDSQKVLHGYNLTSIDWVDGGKRDTTSIQLAVTSKDKKLSGVVEYRDQKITDSQLLTCDNNVQFQDGSFGNSLASNIVRGYSDRIERDIGVRVDYRPTEKFGLYIRTQQAIDGTRDAMTTFGVDYTPTEKFALKAEQTMADRGSATRLTFTSNLTNDMQLYSDYLTTQESYYGNVQQYTVGGRRSFGENGNIYVEERFTHEEGFDERNTRGTVMGFKHSLTNYLDVDLSYENGMVEALSDTWNRSSIGVGLWFKNNDFVQGYIKSELRNDLGVGDHSETVWAGRLKFKFTDSFFGMLNANYSKRDDRTLNLVQAQYNERNVGLAYRPRDNDRLNLLLKYSQIEEILPGNQGNTQSISGTYNEVYSIEGIYQISPRLQLMEKYAMRKARDLTGPRFDTPFSETNLFIHRLTYHIDNKWDASVEYRNLAQHLAMDEKSGFLLEVSRKIQNNLWIGVGYNFTDFKDNLLTDNDYTMEGFFIRLSGTY